MVTCQKGRSQNGKGRSQNGRASPSEKQLFFPSNSMIGRRMAVLGMAVLETAVLG